MSFLQTTKFIICAILPVVLSATVAARDKSLIINAGDDKAAVLAAMGEPEDRQFEGIDEAWQYCSTGFANGKYTVIFFRNKVITSVKKYSHPLGPLQPCERSFSTIIWGDRPDVVVEVRK